MEAREKCDTLFNVAMPEYSENFSYTKNDWRKIQRWIMRATNQLYIWPTFRYCIMINYCYYVN